MAQVLERGDIYFFYRPRQAEPHPDEREEIQRSYVILAPRTPHGSSRLLVIGQKKLPDIEPGESRPEERVWAFVDGVSPRPADLLARLQEPARGGGERPLARAAGEGKYALVAAEDATFLAYALELPHEPGPVQHALAIQPEASYVISVKNPAQPSRTGMEQRAEYPDDLRALFGARAFIPVTRPILLDYHFAQVVLVGASTTPERELGVSLGAERGAPERGDIFRQLQLDRSREPVEPLLSGQWQ